MTGCQSSLSNTSEPEISLEEVKEIKKTLPNRVLEDSAKKYAELSADENLSRATFAGGCFWCIEGPFESRDGVIEAFPGYAGGEEVDGNYKDVSGGKTGHREAVQVFYNPAKISYNELLEIFWHQIDPTDDGGQFADRGFHYTTAIYWHNGTQKFDADKSREILNNSEKFETEVATKVIPFTSFYLAEENHQNYYLKQSKAYKRYKKGSGRTDFIHDSAEVLDEIFEQQQAEPELSISEETENSANSYNLSPEEIQERLKNLDPASFHVVSGGTEKPFFNKYWNNKKAGIYVDKITGEPLFSSTHKYDSGTGWPTFYRSIKDDVVTESTDLSLGMARTELTSKNSGSHLGHIFDDGPADKGGKRLCVNSASLRFIPAEEIDEEGYGEFMPLFE